MTYNYWWGLLAYGAFYFFAPHTLHVSTSLGFGLEHSWHQMIGLGLMIVSGFQLTRYGNR